MSVPEALTGLTDAATDKQGDGEIRFLHWGRISGKGPRCKYERCEYPDPAGLFGFR